MVAIPTGIISAGFVEQYTKLKKISEVSHGEDLKFIMITVENDHPWVKQCIGDIKTPPEFIIITIIRNRNPIIPTSDTIIHIDDKIIIGVMEYKDDIGVYIEEIKIDESNSWKDKYLKELYIPRSKAIASIVRDSKPIMAGPDTMIKAGDIVTVIEKTMKS
jgi:voltage-gated potassium channel